MAGKLKADKLAVSVYARHGDTCACAPHCESLGCASRCKPDDMVLCARFAYLQEAIDYCVAVGNRGVRSRLVSRIVPGAPYVSDYPKARNGVCIADGCGIPLDIADKEHGAPTDADKDGKAFAGRYCRKCLARRPKAEVIIARQ